MRSTVIVFIGLFIFFLITISARAASIYVDADALGVDDGSSWANAYTDLQDALTGSASGDEIWVAEGTYYPGTTRDDFFQMKNGVAIYGGFDGTESALDQRNPATHPTVLSGDIGTADDTSDNSYHIFFHPSTLGLDATAVLDGFTLIGGNANGSSTNIYGGGMYNNTATPTIRNCRFIDNDASSHGGAIYNTSSWATLIGCYFGNNQSGTYGGAVYNDNSSSVMTSCSFQGNHADDRGGAVVNLSASDSVITNCTFSENTSVTYGGAIYNATSTPVISNSILWANASATGNEIFNGSDGPTISYSIIENCGGSGAGWDSGLGTDGGNNIQTDPYFVPDSELHISKDSPGIDALALTPPVPNDVDNEARPTDGIGVDIGADEFVDTDGDDLSDWEEVNVYGTLPDNVDSDGDGLEDGDEHYTHLTNPTLSDTDGDGLSDGEELNTYDTNPRVADPDADTDGDRLTNRDEIDRYNTDPSLVDSDGDDFDDAVEVWHGSEPDDGTDTPAAATLYVDAAATSGSNGGQSWTNAFTDLQDALFFAESGDQIWVAQGTYYPGTESADYFSMKNGVGIYGGFTGSETALSERDPEAYPTILSGDIDKDGVLNDGNSYHVIYSYDETDLDETAILDGFTITGGYAIYPSTVQGNGGGMFIFGDAPSVIQCTFVSNYASWSGGAVAISGGSPIFTDCTFSENLADDRGGAMIIKNSNPTFTGCTFNENQSDDGGAIYNSTSYGTFTDCIFSKNSARFIGAMYNYQSSPTITGYTFIENFADDGAGGGSGGGMYNTGGSPVITGCSFIGNWANEQCGALANYTPTATITDCSFIDNQAQEGAGIYSLGGSTIGACTFSGNQASLGGGISCLINDAGGQIISCVFTGNQAESGAGIHIYAGCDVRIGNCTFTGNQASDLGGGIYNASDETIINNSILWNNTAATDGNELYNASATATVAACDIEGSGGSGTGWAADIGTDGGYNIDATPGFVAADDFHLASDSPCIDAGINGLLLSGHGTDIDKETRVMDGNGDWIFTVDIGVDEYVDSDGDGLSDMDERNTYGTDPRDPDSDNDGISDSEEIANGTDPIVGSTTATSDDGGSSSGCFISTLGR